MRYEIIWLKCPECDSEHPVGVNKSPGVEREMRCPRCLNVEIARLQRLINQIQK